jgi:predicted DNA-binding transcriptional regulator AlpA
MARKSNVEKQTYTAPDIATYLDLSLSGTYNLMQAVDFPSFRVGGRIMVTKAAFEEWLAKQQEQGKAEREAAVCNGPWGRSSLG